MSNDEIFEKFTLTFTLLSIISSYFFILILKKNITSYGKIIKHVVLSEAIYLFCILLFIFETSQKYAFHQASRRVFHLFTFNFFNDTKGNIQYEVKDNLNEFIELNKIMIRFNISAYYSMEIFSLFLSVFICLEVILVMKNPIAQMKNRVKFYFIFVYTIAIIVFILNCLFIDLKNLEVKKRSIGNEFKHLFFSLIGSIFSLIAFGLFLIIGSISIIYLILRFCLGKSLIQNLKNVLIIQHISHFVIYILLLLPMKINSVLIILDKEPYMLMPSLMLNSLLGIVMFFIRSCETNFYSVLECDCLNNYVIDGQSETRSINKNRTLISMISKNMNLEFMCCILYGLTEIFYKKKIRKNKNKINKNLNKIFFDENLIETIIENPNEDSFSRKQSKIDNKYRENMEKKNNLKESLLTLNEKQTNIDEYKDPIHVDQLLNLNEQFQKYEDINMSRKKTQFVRKTKLNIIKSQELILSNTNRKIINSQNFSEMDKTKKHNRNRSLSYKKITNLGEYKPKKIAQFANLNFQCDNERQSKIKTGNDEEILFTEEDYKKRKIHQIRYKKIIEGEKKKLNLDEIDVEVSSVRRSNVDDITRNSEIEYSSKKKMEEEEKKQKIKKKQKKSDALIIEYCPRVFKHLRTIDDYDGEELFNSLSPENNKYQMSKIRESEGKSGSFFFFSHDNKFLIKTISDDELKNILDNFMETYYIYISQNPDSLIARIYGIYSIIIKDVTKINIILMENLMLVDKSLIKRIYDLKGSTFKRNTERIEIYDNLKTLKDLDYLWMVKVDPEMINFSDDQIDILSNNLICDLKVLRELYVMDYSLLLIIINVPDSNNFLYDKIFNLFGDKRCYKRIFKSKNGKYIYILGIIDYLQKFNLRKFWENKYKRLIYGEKIKFISSVDPTIYSERMLDFAVEHIFIDAANKNKKMIK